MASFHDNPYSSTTSSSSEFNMDVLRKMFTALELSDKKVNKELKASEENYKKRKTFEAVQFDPKNLDLDEENK